MNEQWHVLFCYLKLMTFCLRKLYDLDDILPDDTWTLGANSVYAYTFKNMLLGTKSILWKHPTLKTYPTRSGTYYFFAISVLFHFLLLTTLFLLHFRPDKYIRFIQKGDTNSSRRKVDYLVNPHAPNVCLFLFGQWNKIAAFLFLEWPYHKY